MSSSAGSGDRGFPGFNRSLGPISLQIQRHVGVADLLERLGYPRRQTVGQELQKFPGTDLDAGQMQQG